MRGEDEGEVKDWKSIAAAKKSTVLVQINSKSVKGEPGTGFEEGGDMGPFECGNCHYFDKDHCEQADMKKLSKQPRNAQGYPMVDGDDCCEYVSRVGK